MKALLNHILQTLDRDGIRYCLLRDGHQLERFADGGEIDLLVEPGRLKQLQAALRRFGFIRLRAWGHGPHHFFLTYNEPSHRWLKLDVVTKLAYGRPIRALHTGWAEGCLARRRRCGPAFVLSPEDELATLLLHCVLDKGVFTLANRQRLRTLRRQVDDERHLAELIRAYWSPRKGWPDVAESIDSGAWPALLAEGPAVAARLAARNWPATLVRRIRDRVLRKLHRGWRMLRPQAPTVAILAPDGAGKSTLIAAIGNSFHFPTRAIYMGLYQKPKTHRGRLRIPGKGLACSLLTQWGRYLAARYHQARGRLVLFDRYTYDAMLPRDGPQGLLRRWRRRLLAYACPAPGLIVMLDAPGDVLYARKREHSAAALERQRRGYLALRTQLPQMVVVDATREPEDLCRKVTAVIWRRYAETLDGRRSP